MMPSSSLKKDPKINAIHELNTSATRQHTTKHKKRTDSCQNELTPTKMNTPSPRRNRALGLGIPRALPPRCPSLAACGTNPYSPDRACTSFFSILSSLFSLVAICGSLWSRFLGGYLLFLLVSLSGWLFAAPSGFAFWVAMCVALSGFAFWAAICGSSWLRFLGGNL